MYYLLKDGNRLRRAVVAQFDPTLRGDVDGFIGDACRILRDYGQGRTVMSAIVSVVIGLAALLLGLPLVFTIMVVNFVGGYIPYIGAFLGGGLAVIVALGDGGLAEAAIMLVVVLASNLVLENFVEPKVMGRSLDIHPLVVLVVTALGGLLGGIVGLILAVPAYVIARNAIGRFRSRGVVDKVADRAQPDRATPARLTWTTRWRKSQRTWRATARPAGRFELERCAGREREDLWLCADCGPLPLGLARRRLLLRTERPLRMGLCFLAGAATCELALGAALVVIGRVFGLDEAQKETEEGSVDLIIGAVLIVLGRPPRAASPRRASRAGARSSTTRASGRSSCSGWPSIFLGGVHHRGHTDRQHLGQLADHAPHAGARSRHRAPVRGGPARVVPFAPAGPRGHRARGELVRAPRPASARLGAHHPRRPHLVDGIVALAS